MLAGYGRKSSGKTCSI